MRSFNEFNNISNKTRKSSLNSYGFPQIKQIINKNNLQFNKSMKKLDISNLRKKSIRENHPQQDRQDSEELYFLSNANLNIINILNTCVSEGFYNDSFINDKPKEKQKNNLYKNKRQSKSEKNKEFELKKNKFKNNLNSNRTQLGKDNAQIKKFNFFSSVESDSPKIFQKTTYKKKFLEKELEGNKNIYNFDKNNSSYGYESLSLKNHKKKLSINPKQRSKSNKRLCNLKIDHSISSSLLRNLSSKKLDSSGILFGQLNDMDLFKINENITHEVNYIQLKKKITKLKKKIEKKYSSKSTAKYKNDGESSPIRSKRDNKINNEDEKINNKTIDNNYKSSIIKKNSTINNAQSEENHIDIIDEKYRYVIRKKCLYDSIDDEEYNDELIDYYITPNSLYIKIFDILIFISSMFYFIFVPFLLSQNYFILKENFFCQIILIIIDILYIIDVILNFFRAYQAYDEHLIRRTRKIIIHYIKTWFIFDIIQSIPYFSLFQFLLKNGKRQINYIQLNPFLYILIMLKSIKLYKMFNDNTTISYFSEILSRNETLDENGSIFVTVWIFLFCINFTSCVFIFLGFNSYPSWIIKLNIQDEPYSKIYLTSAYFIIVTVTTVGYGDITGGTIPEVIFQLILLIIGTIAYSFIISYISNYIVKRNQKSMSFEKNVEILREIKFHHPNMKKSIYHEVLRTLQNEQMFEKKDKHLLFDCLPYSLKNELIMEMYKPLIKNFIFFKDVDNSDFVIKVATALKPLISIKGDILIQEGDFVKEIIFVKNGVIGLNICIDLDDIENSIKKYVGQNEIGKLDITYLKSGIISQKNTTRFSFANNLDTFLMNKLEDSDSNEESENYENIEDIRILEIRKNEHFGDALMFLNERCPLIVKVRTRNAELLILRKMEAIEIYSIYPNIWRRINKKSLYNMEQIYQKIKTSVVELSHRYNVKIEKTNNKKSFKKLFKNKKYKRVRFSTDFKNKNIIKKENNEKKDENKQSQKDINESKSEEKKLSEKQNIIREMTFDKSKSNDKDTTLSNDISKIKIKKNESLHSLLVKEMKNNLNKNEDDKNYKIKNSVEIRITNLTNSIVKTNSFKIIHENDEINKKRENNDKNKKKDKFNISIQKQSFVIKGRSLTLRQDSKESLKVNDSYESKCSNDTKKSITIKNKKSNIATLSKTENLIYNAFINLNSTKENSLQLDSSYENINQISNNKYIHDISLQSKTRKFIINECLEGENNIQNNKKGKRFSLYIHAPTHSPDSRFNYEKLHSFKIGTGGRLSDSGFDKTFKYSQSLKKINTNKSKNFENKNENSNNKSEKSSSLVKNDNKLSKFSVIRNSKRFGTSKINSPSKMRRKLSKKKLVKVKQKLKSISKNIQSTNNAINNPNEFYMNFFNKIMNKKSFGVVNEKDEEKNISSFIVSKSS